MPTPVFRTSIPTNPANWWPVHIFESINSLPSEPLVVRCAVAKPGRACGLYTNKYADSEFLQQSFKRLELRGRWHRRGESEWEGRKNVRAVFTPLSGDSESVRSLRREKSLLVQAMPRSSISRRCSLVQQLALLSHQGIL